MHQLDQLAAHKLLNGIFIVHLCDKCQKTVIRWLCIQLDGIKELSGKGRQLGNKLAAHTRGFTVIFIGKFGLIFFTEL